jgi:hypothetical protein
VKGGIEMGFAILRFCIIGLIVLICIAIGILQLFPPEAGLLTIIIVVLVGVFFQNERELALLQDLLKELQTQK